MKKLEVKRLMSPKTCQWCRLCSYVIPIVLIIVSSLGLVYATGNADKLTPDKLKNLIPSFEKTAVNDPYAGSAGKATSDVPKWNNNGGSGIEIDLLNALDDSWQVVYSLAVADWEFGRPDSLTLKSVKIPHNVECEPEAGKVKVCNGDYGETSWRGINSALLGNGFITASAARMNEFYLQHDPLGARQYTMCHEIGHSFGLPHSDEDFGNEDLGNCMDYTENFDFNKHPDHTNYEYLADLYGPTGGRRLRRDPSPVVKRNPSAVVKEIPETIQRKMAQVVSNLSTRMDDAVHEDGWRLLHRSEGGVEHEIDLGEGYQVRVHMLLA